MSLRRLVTEGGDLLVSDGAIGRGSAAFLDANERLKKALDASQAARASPCALDGEDLSAAARAAAASLISHASPLNG